MRVLNLGAKSKDIFPSQKLGNKPLSDYFETFPCTFQPEEKLFQTGAPVTGIYYLWEGAVKLQKMNGGDSVTFYIARPGDFIGLNDLFQERDQFTITAIALGTVRTGFITEEHYFELIQKQPGLTIAILNRMNDQIARIERRTKRMENLSSFEMIKNLVAYFVRQFGVDENHFLSIPLSPEDIADLSGISKSYMRKLLPQFREQTMFESKKRKLKILDLNWIEDAQ